MDGFSLGQRIKNKCGMRASSTAELVFDDLKVREENTQGPGRTFDRFRHCVSPSMQVPAHNMIGEEGDAVSHMMRNLEIERLGLGK